MVKKYNYDFKIKDLRATTSKHKVQIQRSKNVPYSEIIHRFMEDNILSDIWSSTQWQLRYYRELHTVNNQLVKDLKRFVNYFTREAIRRQLVESGYPKSWDTAFYVSHKAKIDAMMKRIVKELIRSIPKKKGR